MGTLLRHTRQVRLAEVGESGQARLAGATIDVAAPGFAGEVEARYLAAAGVGSLRVREEPHAHAARAIDAGVVVTRGESGESERPADGPVAAFASLDPAARDVAVGAWSALRALRGVLGRGCD